MDNIQAQTKSFGSRLRGFIRRLPRLTQEENLARIFSHQGSLERLAARGFAPRVIYDIGAYHGTWTRNARRVFPQARYFLFDANSENAPRLQSSGAVSFLVALGGVDAQERSFYLPPARVIGTGASLYREQTIHYESGNVRVATVTVRRLDAFCTQHGVPSPDLMKLDVQGAELDVLAGAGVLLQSCQALITELSLLRSNEGAPLAAEVVWRMHELGFVCTDLCEVHRSVRTGTAMQLDILFTSAALYQRFRQAESLR